MKLSDFEKMKKIGTVNLENGNQKINNPIKGQFVKLVSNHYGTRKNIKVEDINMLHNHAGYIVKLEGINELFVLSVSNVDNPIFTDDMRLNSMGNKIKNDPGIPYFYRSMIKIIKD